MGIVGSEVPPGRIDADKELGVAPGVRGGVRRDIADSASEVSHRQRRYEAWFRRRPISRAFKEVI